MNYKLPHPTAGHSCGNNVIPAKFRFGVGANHLHKPCPHGDDNRPNNILQAVSQNADNSYRNDKSGESDKYLADSCYNAVKPATDTRCHHSKD